MVALTRAVAAGYMWEKAGALWAMGQFLAPILLLWHMPWILNLPRRSRTLSGCLLGFALLWKAFLSLSAIVPNTSLLPLHGSPWSYYLPIKPMNTTGMQPDVNPGWVRPFALAPVMLPCPATCSASGPLLDEHETSQWGTWEMASGGA